MLSLGNFARGGGNILLPSDGADLVIYVEKSPRKMRALIYYRELQ